MSKGYKLIITAIMILLVLLNLIIFLKTFIKEPDSENITFQYFL